MDIFQISEGSFNPMLLLPVLSVVIAIVAVFVFGFKKPENPNFRKIGNEHSGGAGSINSNNSKRQKRNVTTEATSPLQQQQHPKPAVTIKAVKKEAAAVAAVIEAKVAVSNKTKTPAASKSQTKKSMGKVPKVTHTKENKSNAKNTEKPLDDGGEWRTVVPKKQKKPTTTTNDLLIQAVAEAAAGASFTKSGANEKNKNLKNNNNNKQAKEQANKTKKATGEQQQRVKESVAVVDNKSLEEGFETTNKTAEAAIVVEKTLFSDITPNVNVAPALKLPTEVVEIISVHQAAKHTDPPAEDSNLVLDELADATWTEAKTPKKSKKRALRE